MAELASGAARGAEGDIDLGSVGRALWRRKHWIVIPTVAVVILTTLAVNFVDPRYKSEARVLFEGRENVFLRPEADKTVADPVVGDQDAIANQVQLVLSREVALDVIKKLKLGDRPEFDSVLGGISPLKYLTMFFGISRDPFQMTPEERVLEAYYDRLNVFAIDKSRVIVIEFQSGDPEIAALVANGVAEAYIARRQGAKEEQNRAAGQWLAGEIEKLRARVAEAEAKAESFRSRTNLFVGPNNTSLSNQQLGEFSSQLAVARGQKADAETRAKAIRDLLRKGDAIEASDVANSELIRRLTEQRVTLRAQLAEQSSTLLDGHPRIKELRAQLSDLDRQVRVEADRIGRAFESDAKIAGARVDALTVNLDAVKKQATTNNEQDVQLRALDRDAKSQRDLLESYLAKYREATARQSIGNTPPADARIISRAIVSNTPFFPKKVPIILIAAFAALALSSGLIMTGEVLRANALSGRAMPVSIGVPDATDVGAAEPKSMEPRPAASIGAADDIARKLRDSADIGRRISVFGTTRGEGTSLVALTIARLLAQDSRVVMVDLAQGNPRVRAISSDPNAPGIAELIHGACSFGDLITRDKLSRLHLVGAGQVGSDIAGLIASFRFVTTIEALARSYDYLIIDAGMAPEAALTGLAVLAPRAVLVTPDGGQRSVQHAGERLAAAGFTEILVAAGKPFPSADRPIAA